MYEHKLNVISHIMITMYNYLKIRTNKDISVTFNIDEIKSYISSKYPIQYISDMLYVLPPPYEIPISFNDVNVYETIDTIINKYINSSALGFPEPNRYRHLYDTFIQIISIDDPLYWISITEYQIFNIIDTYKRII